MNGKSICKTCKKEFKWRRDKTRKSPEYCSIKCFSVHPKTWVTKRFNNLREDEAYKKQKYVQRFQKNVIKKEGCWCWKGSIHKTGYAPFKSYGGKNGTAHRASWIIYKGEIPKDKYVLHKCDNRQCVNPEHLFLGTAKDNAEDRQEKKRGKSGKLTENKVVEIRNLYNIGVRPKRLCIDYDVSSVTIWKIVTRKTWKHI